MAIEARIVRGSYSEEEEEEEEEDEGEEEKEEEGETEEGLGSLPCSFHPDLLF